MISFCCSLMNRGPSFRRMFESLTPALNEGHELIVADFGSDDIDLMGLPIRLVQLSLPFRRAMGHNHCAAHAHGHILFFLDADMLVSPDWAEIVQRNVALRRPFFPICFSLHESKPPVVARENGWWRRSGYGICGFVREDFIKLRGFNSDFRGWGGEDHDLWRRAYRMGMQPNRFRCNKLFHQWHPEHLEYKNRYC